MPAVSFPFFCLIFSSNNLRRSSLCLSVSVAGRLSAILSSLRFLTPLSPVLAVDEPMPAPFVPVFGAVLPFVPALAALALLLMDVEASRSRITPVDAGAREGRDSTAATSGVVRIRTHQNTWFAARTCSRLRRWRPAGSTGSGSGGGRGNRSLWCRRSRRGATASSRWGILAQNRREG